MARHGGEAFAIVLSDTGRAKGLVKAEGRRVSIERIQVPQRPITASIGIATLDSRHNTRESLISATDEALYEAKRRGRNCVVHASELQHASPIR